MSSKVTSGSLGDINTEIANGVIEGSFNANRTEFNFTELSYSGSKGKTMKYGLRITLKYKNNTVEIKSEYLATPCYKLSTDFTAIIETFSSQEEGKVRDSVPTVVTAGVNIGKKNETNCITQAFKKAYSLHNSKKKTSDINTADTSDCKLPMLVQVWGKTKRDTWNQDVFTNGVSVQRKINGARAVFFNDVFYSRKCQVYKGFDNFAFELNTLLNAKTFTSFIESKYPGIDIHVDGEMYKHGMPLNEISGKVRRETNADDLEYWVFDMFSLKYPALKSIERNEIITHLISNETQHIKLVGNFKVTSVSEMMKYYDTFVKEGYEGLIARKDNEIYEFSPNNYHSPNVLKVKPLYDSEFEIVGFTEGTVGKDKGAMVWILKTEKGEEFHVVQNETLENRHEQYKKCSTIDGYFDENYKGKFMTVQYPEISDKTGKPIQAKALRIRDD